MFLFSRSPKKNKLTRRLFFLSFFLPFLLALDKVPSHPWPRKGPPPAQCHFLLPHLPVCRIYCAVKVALQAPHSQRQEPTLHPTFRPRAAIQCRDPIISASLPFCSGSRSILPLPWSVLKILPGSSWSRAFHLLPPALAVSMDSSLTDSPPSPPARYSYSSCRRSKGSLVRLVSVVSSSRLPSHRSFSTFRPDPCPWSAPVLRRHSSLACLW